jgi:hypothetical protein
VYVVFDANETKQKPISKHGQLQIVEESLLFYTFFLLLRNVKNDKR